MAKSFSWEMWPFNMSQKLDIQNQITVTIQSFLKNVGLGYREIKLLAVASVNISEKNELLTLILKHEFLFLNLDSHF